MTNTQTEVEAIDDEILKRYVAYARVIGWGIKFEYDSLFLDVPGVNGRVQLEVFTEPNAELICHQVELIEIDMRRLHLLLEFMNCWNDHTWFGNLQFMADAGVVVWRYGLMVNEKHGVTDGQIAKIAYTAIKAVESAMPALCLIRDTKYDLETISIHLDHN